MKIINEFREFAVKGNAIDMAVGVIIGAAFGKIVSSMIDDLIMPLIAGIMRSGVDFSNYFFFLGSTESAVPPVLTEARKLGPVLAFGNFVTIMINFVILAFCVFMLVKFINSLRAKPAPTPSTPPAPSSEELLLTEIRDLLKHKS